MLYDLSKQIDRSKVSTKINYLLEKGCVIELTEKRNKRSINQNSYLHLLLSYFAIETGYTLEYVKRNFFKIHCNSDLFIVKVSGKLGDVEDLRSSSDLDTKELTISIDRFRHWSNEDAGVYLPLPGEEQFLREIEVMISQQQQYL